MHKVSKLVKYAPFGPQAENGAGAQRLGLSFWSKSQNLVKIIKCCENHQNGVNSTRMGENT